MSSGLPKPYFKLVYRGVDISGDLDPMTTSIRYEDKVHGEADAIDVTVQDKDGRWKGSWKPEAGDTMDLTIFDGAGGILPCGVFEMDEPAPAGGRGGDFMTISGVAVPITKALRTQKTKAFEKQNLSAIVREVAGSSGLSLEGQIDDLFFERVTQRRERDLEFLLRMAEETGHYFNVRDKKLIFTNFKSVDGRAPALVLFDGDRQIIDYNFKFKTEGTYSKGKAAYLDQNKKKKTEHEETDSNIKTGDTLKISGERMESKAHAAARVKSEMHFANRRSFSGSVSTVGNVRLISGNLVELKGYGQYSGKRLVDSASHEMTRGGYISTGELVDARG